MLMRIGYADPAYVGCAYGMAIRRTGIYQESHVTDTDIDLDYEPVLTAEGEVATLSPPTISTNSTASFGKSWPRSQP
jgi:hypothetical protein